jgi:phosphatidylglycerophosphate synthase
MVTVSAPLVTQRIPAPRRGGHRPPAAEPARSGPLLHAPTVGILGQFAVLALVAGGVGLGPVGWLTGTLYAVVTWVTLSRALHRSETRTWGLANTVTLGRATLVGGVAALVADSVAGSVVAEVGLGGALGAAVAGNGASTGTPLAVLIGLATVALLLDAVDGQVARRTGTTSSLGARFDMEVDAFLILVLSVFLAPALGGWVLAIGALRYAFVAAARALPWLRAPLPPQLSRKVVAAAQGILLVVAGAGVVPTILAFALVGGALAMLCWSFGRDIGWLWAHRHPVGQRPERVDTALVTQRRQCDVRATRPERQPHHGGRTAAGRARSVSAGRQLVRPEPG